MAPPPPPPASAVESPISVTPVAVSLPSPPRASGVQKPLSRQVSEFEDYYGLVVPYCGLYEFEWNPDGYDYREECDTEDEDDTNHVADPIPTLIRYVNQIRQSFGFDVDCIAPSWFNGPFRPVDISKAKHSDDKFLYDYITRIVDFAIPEINADIMSGSGKSIELVELEKVVLAGAWSKLLTLRVKEVDAGEVADDTKIIQAIVNVGPGPDSTHSLEQWRFKPEGDDAWYKPGDDDDA